LRSPTNSSQTFTIRTIKHSFQNAGIWPVSFTAVKRKLQEYRKKGIKGNSLELLEYGSDVESEEEPGPTLKEYQLPQLPPPPSSYHKYVTALQDINPKI
jgi:hypothetical protein